MDIEIFFFFSSNQKIKRIEKALLLSILKFPSFFFRTKKSKTQRFDERYLMFHYSCNDNNSFPPNEIRRYVPSSYNERESSLVQVQTGGEGKGEIKIYDE